jgi:predicted metal-binding membrane protein
VTSTARFVRFTTVATLVSLATVCWILLVWSESAMATMQGDGLLMDVAVAMMRPTATVPYFCASVSMWVVMMLAMMIPAVLPMVLTFSRLERGGQADAALFAGGYLLAWSAFAILATGLQWMLHRSSRLHGHQLAAPPLLAGILLIAAGVYQLTPLKAACLAHCQSPLAFLLSHWRDGAMGALRMGVRHGTYCLGCCWVLMLLMFVYGVMSAAAMAGLAMFIVAERLLPAGPLSAKLPGIVLVALGLWTLGGA